LVRSEPFDEYYLPEGISAVRILYHSVAANGADVASSGVVLIPDGTPPRDGWPVIAWGHRFIATARPCAPSLMRGLYSGPLLSMYVKLGYAVVATDYVGLGTAFRSASFDLRSNATDIINSVTAARAAVRHLSASWIAVGEAEGGAAVLSVAELEAKREDPNYLGSVAISCAADLKTRMERLAKGPWEDTFASVAYGVKTVYPEFRLEDVFSHTGLARHEAVVKACRTPPHEQTPPLQDMLKPKWESNSYISDFWKRNTLGLARTRAPLLILAAETEQQTPPIAADVVARMCHQGDYVDFETYPSLDPASLIGESVEAQIAWIQARFSGRMTKNTCR
jgi:hypothetical protein